MTRDQLNTALEPYPEPVGLAAWWHVVAWDVVDERLREVRAGTSPL